MDKLRLRFEKTGRAVWISHLDLMHTMQRAFSRAGYELKYSEGFNPHPQISIALPLSVCVQSYCEIMDFRLVRDAVLDELTEVAGGEWDAEAVYEAIQLQQAIDSFAKELPERERYLFIRRDFYAEDISKIAERYSMTQNNVTVNLSRSRKKLKKYLSERGFIQ